MERSSNHSPSGITPKLTEVLVVDDDPDCRVMLTTALELNRCLVRSVSSVREATIALAERTPDVLVCDLHLGSEETGWTLAERMRDELATRHVARIALTGLVEPRLEVVRAFDAYLRKPVDIPLLVELVRQLTPISRGLRHRTAV